MRVMVYEGGRGGHVYNYLRLLLPTLAELAEEVIVVVHHKAFDSEEFQCQVADLGDQIRWEPRIPTLPPGLVSSGWVSRKTLKKAVHEFRPDHVYVPTGDGISPILGLARAFDPFPLPSGTEAEAGFHRGGFAYRAASIRKRVQHRLTYYATRWTPWTRLHHVDVLAYEWLVARGGALAGRCRLLPDPVESLPAATCAEARRKLNLPEEGRIVGCVGIIDERKGIDLLLGAFAKADLRPDDRLLLVGQHAALIKELLAGDYADLVKRGRIITIDRYVDIEELTTAISAMNLVCTPHNRHIGISSIVIRAAAGGRPVLAADYGWSKVIVPKFDLGWTCRVQEADPFADMLRRCLESCDGWNLGEAGRRFVAFNSSSNFIAAWTERLRERLELPPADNRHSWDWVLEASDG